MCASVWGMFTQVQVQVQEEAGHSGARVTGGYKLPNVGAENQAQALHRAVHLPSCWVTSPAPQNE